ncbi:MAG: alpha/beta fold hydrolase, partial [Candidatus Chisholmbacteria bacterium]|nr:alpha/beta fold hydrolase [Candidatus Chisholmbacteria bacterium]
EVYETGLGTRKVAAVLAKNGFTTLAADFLGYGESDPESNDILEARFEKVVTAMYLLEAIDQVPNANSQKLVMWGHSNGGQIALSVLAVSGQETPTSLWAPVSKPFPYNILYYSDELSDRGKMIRKAVAEFEQEYDADEYSVNYYYDFIKAPLQVHQGTVDESVPKSWSDQLVSELKTYVTDLTYHVYSGADHNLSSGWETAVGRDVAFFRERVK